MQLLSNSHPCIVHDVIYVVNTGTILYTGSCTNHTSLSFAFQTQTRPPSSIAAAAAPLPARRSLRHEINRCCNRRPCRSVYPLPRRLRCVILLFVVSVNVFLTVRYLFVNTGWIVRLLFRYRHHGFRSLRRGCKLGRRLA